MFKANNHRIIPAFIAISIVLISVTGCKTTQSKPGDEFDATSQLESFIEIEGTTEPPRDRSVGYYVDAMMLNDLNNRENAIRKLNLALELNPEFALAYSLKGDILQDLEKFEESAEAYEKATEMDPWSFKDFFNLGKVTQAIKQFARAVKAYVAACNLDPKHYQAHIGAAKCYYELEEYENSIAYAQKAKELDPSKADSEQLLGDLFEAQENHPEAINAYRRALELEGNQPEIMVSLARAYLRTGRYDSARELLTDVTLTEQDNGMAYQYLGFTHLKLQDTQAAIRCYQRAVDIDNNDWMAHKGLGVAYMLLSMNQNNNQQIQTMATEQWKISLQIKADQPKLKQLLDRYTN